MIAAKVNAMIANGSGGIDWAGLPYAVAFYGVRDIAGLLTRLQIIRRHDPERA